MVIPRSWIAAAACFFIGSTHAIPRPQDAESTPVGTPGDIASDFLTSLIQNVTQVEEEQQQQATKRTLSCGQPEALTVNVGYAKYQGYYNASSGLNYWKGCVARVFLVSHKNGRFRQVRQQRPRLTATWRP